MTSFQPGGEGHHSGCVIFTSTRRTNLFVERYRRKIEVLEVNVKTEGRGEGKGNEKRNGNGR